jgi:hypothetical protein
MPATYVTLDAITSDKRAERTYRALNLRYQLLG